MTGPALYGILLGTVCLGCATEMTSVAPARDDLREVATRATISRGISPLIEVDAPPDATSMLIEVRGSRGTYEVVELVGPDGAVIGGDRFATEMAAIRGGNVNWLYPNRPDEQLRPGRYGLRIASEANGLPSDEEVTVHFVFKTGEGACTLALNIIYDDSLVGAQGLVASADALRHATAAARDFFAQAEIEFEDGAFTAVDVPTVGYDLAPERNVLGFAQAAIAQAGSLPSGVQVIVVPDIGGTWAVSHGMSLGLPGTMAADTPTSAVFVAAKGFVRDGELDTRGLATTIAHETAHYLGLYHTLEADGSLADPIGDTPRPDSAGTNLMTSVPLGAEARRSVFSAGQAQVMRRHPLCQPQ